MGGGENSILARVTDYKIKTGCHQILSYSSPSLSACLPIPVPRHAHFGPGLWSASASVVDSECRPPDSSATGLGPSHSMAWDRKYPYAPIEWSSR